MYRYRFACGAAHSRDHSQAGRHRNGQRSTVRPATMRAHRTPPPEHPRSPARARRTRNPSHQQDAQPADPVATNHGLGQKKADRQICIPNNSAILTPSSICVAVAWRSNISTITSASYRPPRELPTVDAYSGHTGHRDIQIREVGDQIVGAPALSLWSQALVRVQARRPGAGWHGEPAGQVEGVQVAIIGAHVDHAVGYNRRCLHEACCGVAP